jgi:CHAD domain-containing protein
VISELDVGFKFSTKDRSVQKGIRRIAQNEAGTALKHLEADLANDPDAVHGVRKSTKKLRGLLRLIRPVFADAKAEDVALRDAARKIAGLRDAEVMRRTFDGLAGDLPKSARSPLRAVLDARVEEAAGAASLDAAAEAVRSEFEGFRKRARSWKIQGDDFAALEPGLAETWTKARKGLKKAQKAFEQNDFPGEPLHSWRKQVKRHWYQARLLAPIWPEMMAPHVEQADALGEVLGLHNDLEVLLSTLADDPALAESPALDRLRKAVVKRRRALAAEALSLGARFFAEPTDALIRRWGDWFQLWRA